MMRTLSCLAVLALLVACGDQIQFADPPDHSQGASTGGREQRIESHGAASGGQGAPEDPFADEGDAGKPAVDPSGRANASKVYFKGTIAVDPSITLPANYSVFVMAATKPTGVDPATGQPKRSQPMFVTVYKRPKMPLTFELTGANMFGKDTVPDEPLALGYILSEKGTVDPSADGSLFLRRMITETLYAPGSMDVKMTITR